MDQSPTEHGSRPLSFIDELRARSEQQRAIADLGRAAIVGTEIPRLLDEASKTVVETLGVEYAGIVELQASGRLLLTAGAGWRPGCIGHAEAEGGDASQEGYTLSIGEPVVVSDFADERRLRPSPLVTAHGAVSGISVVIRQDDHPYGVLAAFTTRRRDFSEDDVRFMRGIANTLGLALQRDASLQALRRSELLYKSLAENSPAIVTTSDPAGNVTYLNNRWYEYTGMSRDATPEERLAVFHPDEIASLTARLRDVRKRGNEPFTLEFRLRRADGEYRWHTARIVSLRDEAGAITGWLSTSGDIHERRTMEDALRTSAERLRRAQQAGRLGSFDWDVRTGKLVWDGVEEVHRMPPGSFGGSFDAYLKDIHPEDTQRVQQALRNVVEHGEDVRIEYRIVPPDGNVVWVEGKGEAVLDANGAVVRVVGTCQDVSERRRLIEELQEANAAKDEFLSLVSHELRTPITTIYGNAEVLQRQGSKIDEPTRLEALQDIRFSALRLHRIITNLLVLARMDRGLAADREPTMMRHVITQLVREHQRMHESRPIEIHADVPPTPIIAAREYLEIVLRNLLSNAEKYSPPRVPIELAISLEGAELVVTVADHGIGITQDEAAELFTPFYRSRRAAARASGIGVGLVVCQRLIEAEGGRIWAMPRDGGGAVFSFALPTMVIEPATEPDEAASVH